MLFKESTKLTWHMRTFLQFSIFFWVSLKTQTQGIIKKKNKSVDMTWKQCILDKINAQSSVQTFMWINFKLNINYCSLQLQNWARKLWKTLYGFKMQTNTVFTAFTCYWQVQFSICQGKRIWYIRFIQRNKSIQSWKHL